jgi:hypothetical protein
LRCCCSGGRKTVLNPNTATFKAAFDCRLHPDGPHDHTIQLLQLGSGQWTPLRPEVIAPLEAVEKLLDLRKRETDALREPRDLDVA